MQTSLHSHACPNLKSVSKLNGIFTFLIIFLMTISSFGQSDGITFNCGVNIVEFGPPNGTTNGFDSWSSSLSQSGEFSLFVQPATINFPDTWEVYGPDGSGNILYFFSEVFVNDLPSCDVNDWSLGPNISCTSFSVTCAQPTPTWYEDFDSDTFGNPFESQIAVNQPSGFVADNTDCNDGDSAVNPGATELCDGVDNNCDGNIDEGLTTTYYVDLDEDGFGSESDSGEEFCSDPGPGYSLTNDDCIDADPAINPGATEIPFDTIDNDCDPATPDDDGSNVYVFCNGAETKVLICHNGKDKCVSINAFDAHMAHGDSSGSCNTTSAENQEDSADNQDITEVNPTTVDVVFWPNPSNNVFNVKMITPNFEDKVDLQVFDINGRLIHSDVINGNQNYQFGYNLSNGVYFVKLSQTDISKVMKVIKH